jgi:C-terminal processing protease CtpA/Prc
MILGQGCLRAAAAASVCCAVAVAFGAPDDSVDAATRAHVIEQSLRHVRASYVFPEVGVAMENAIRERVARGEYEKVESASELAAKLTADLQAISRDKHLRVQHSQAGTVPTPRLPHDRADGSFGFARVERLPGNVGYIDLRSFSPASLAAGKAAEAMTSIADTDALLIDLRQNGGGDPAMVALLISYLLEGEPIHLNDFLGRDGNVRQQFWTSKDVAGRRYAGKDVYVLTSGFTFSAAEEFAYNLTNLKRATLVGETTGGGANPVTFFELDEGFRISVPTGRARNPITLTNWEGTGVAPDIAVPAQLALHTAHLAALTELAERNVSNSAAIEQVREELEQLRRSGAS